MYRNYIYILFVALLLCRCSGKPADKEEPPVDLPQIIAAGEITVVTLYSSTSYFEYRMQPMGYEYDLVKNFADAHQLKLHVKVAENVTRLVEMLQAGEADVVAYPIPVNNALKQEAIYCGREILSCQVLVQPVKPGEKRLTNVAELIGKDVYVKANTFYHDRLENLNRELGGGMHIHDIEKDTVTVEDLIEMVSRGDIPYTVSDDHIAKLNKTYFWNIDVDLKISFQQRSMWVVRKSCPLLAEAINAWSSDNVTEHTHKAAVKRYFELSKKMLELSMPAIKDGHISPYDSLFKKYAKSLGWDWELLASVAYQESHFSNTEISWAGAQGLMGIMPATSRTLGVALGDLTDPEISIRTGVEVMRRFRQGFVDITDPAEEIKFTLASYNAGIGHIYDAQRLAEKYGKNPHVWDDNVAEYLLLKNDPDYYNDPLCKYGYLRGKETYNYVREVLGRYDYYKQKLSSI
ncbi:MAG: transglycosylase SLT domain-containing protein [Tannerellaceae bacterium]|jgi:membrane-bound lytic murein transglycosylase F|nr:transglycosylase SLT domain-containing protein [Tannerellaceae bacterium]